MDKSDPYEELKEKTKAVPKDDRKKKTERKKPARWIVVAAAVLVAGIAAALALYFSGGTSNPAVSGTANAAIATITETANKLQDATNSVVSKLIGGAEVPPEAAPATANQTPTAPAVVRRRPQLSSNQSSPYLAATPAAVSQPSNVVGDAETSKPVEPEPAPPVDIGIYSATDTAVQAPVLIYPQLPSKPTEEALLTRPSQLDLLVLEDGTVGEVRLIPQSDRLQDRMMVSAAKAWRFRPALKDGRSVRYRVRIPITW